MDVLISRVGIIPLMVVNSRDGYILQGGFSLFPHCEMFQKSMDGLHFQGCKYFTGWICADFHSGNYSINGSKFPGWQDFTGWI